MSPPPRAGRRPWRACSRASRTKAACAVRLTRQPTIRRGIGVDKGDIDEARPGRDAGEVGDPQHVRRGAWNWRLTWSRGQGAALSLTVVRIGGRSLRGPWPSSSGQPCSGRRRSPRDATAARPCERRGRGSSPQTVGPHPSRLYPILPEPTAGRGRRAWRHGRGRSTGRSAAPCRSAQPHAPCSDRR